MEYIKVGDRTFELKSHLLRYIGDKPSLEMVLQNTSLDALVESFADGVSYQQITGDGISIDRSEYDTLHGIRYLSATAFEVVMYMGDPVTRLQSQLETEKIKSRNLLYQVEQVNQEMEDFSQALQEVIDR